MSAPTIALVARLAASAADARRGVVRLHPEVLDALGLRSWDAVTLTGSRVTTALVAPAAADGPPGQATLDDVTLSNAGLSDGAGVVIAPARVEPGRQVLLTGSRLARAGLTPETVRLALLGKIVAVGDAVSLLPQDIEPVPDLDVPAARRRLAGAVGHAWTTELLTVAAVDPAGAVAVHPSTVVGWQGGPTTGQATERVPGPVGAPVVRSAARPDGRSGQVVVAPPAPVAAPATVGVEQGNEAVLDVDELVGNVEAAHRLVEWLDLTLRRPELLARLGGSPRLGVLVVGPEGVGKATLVHSAAAAVDASWVELSAPGTAALEAGAVAARVADVVGAARESARGGRPTVLILNDVHALLPAESPPPLSTIVLDALRDVLGTAGLALVATTSAPESVDPRLRGPDLVDRELGIGLPDLRTRTELLRRLLTGVPLSDGVDLKAVAERTPGFVAADLVAVRREAAVRAALRHATAPPAGNPPAGNPPAGNPPAETPLADTPPAGNPPAGTPPAGTPPAETPPVATPPVATPPVATPPAGNPPVTTPPVATPPADPPRIGQQDLLDAVASVRPISMSSSDTLQTGGITLDQVGDMAEVKQALTEAVLWPLQYPDSFARLGVAAPRGVLVYGPPGCGKTFLLRALAGTGQLNVLAVKGAELLDKYVGESERAVRELFRKAADAAPALVFLDEVDALAPRRGQSSDSGVADRVVAALLTELDGAEPLREVIVVGATNRPELIDPALLRPGRLERLVYVPPPDAAARAEILRAAGRNTPLAADVDLDALGAELEGYSAADCAAVLREAALTAMRESLDATVVTGAHIAAARAAVPPSLDPAQLVALEAYALRRG